jgi:hypothetical protein
MESGENEVEYRVGYDPDDNATRECVLGLPNTFFIPTDDDTLTIGGIWNNLAKRYSDADIYSCMIDDAFPITPHWDKEMVRMAGLYEAFSWYECSAPKNIGYPTCTKAWFDKVGYIGQDFWPYWFYDSSFAELVQFVTNKPVPISHQLALFSKQEATQNLRQLDHWWGFFNATRPVRVAEAYRIVKPDMTLEEFTNSRLRWIALGEARDAEFRGTKIAAIESARAVGEPSARYLAAFKRSEEYLATNGLKLWQGVEP